jgi:hypothetical protein
MPDVWVDLENGLQVRFDANGVYRPGDYWLIPTRPLSEAGVEWPGVPGTPDWKRPDGVEHYYAPLARIDVTDAGEVVVEDCRRAYTPIAECHSGHGHTAAHVGSVSYQGESGR